MIEGISIADLTAPGLLGIAILLLLIGKLWTNAAYQQKVKEADQWRLAYEKERSARETSDAQTAELLTVTRTTQAFIMAVFKNSEQIKQAGETDAAATT